MADRRWRKRLSHALEAAVLYPAYGLFALMPLPLASAVGGALGRWIGPLLPPTKIARRNLRMVFPEKSEAEIERIIHAMWDNLGRVAAEFPHVARIRIYEPGSPVEVVGREILDRLAAGDRPAVLFSGHLANWELIRPTYVQSGLAVGVAYRAANNPWVDRLIAHGRRDVGERLIPKGRPGARKALETLLSGQHVALVVDQKMNDGIAVPFLGRNAMTASAPVELARRFESPLVPVRIERVGGARFRVTVLPPLDLPRSADRLADIGAGVALMNRTIEAWIRERPEQWLWVHRRWPEPESDLRGDVSGRAESQRT